MREEYSVWRELEKEINELLSTLARRYKLIYKNPYQAVYGLPPEGFKSDGMLTDGKKLMVVEIEASQPHPDTNVGKYWLLYEKYKKYNKIIVIHIYTPKFRVSSYKWRRELAKFYVKKMKDNGVPIEYIELDFTNNGKNYAQILKEVRTKIKEVIKENFNLFN